MEKENTWRRRKRRRKRRKIFEKDSFLRKRRRKIFGEGIFFEEKKNGKGKGGKYLEK